MMPLSSLHHRHAAHAHHQSSAAKNAKISIPSPYSMQNPTKLMEANEKSKELSSSTLRCLIYTAHQSTLYLALTKMSELKLKFNTVNLITYQFVGVLLIQRLINPTMNRSISQILEISTIHLILIVIHLAGVTLHPKLLSSIQSSIQSAWLLDLITYNR